MKKLIGSPLFLLILLTILGAAAIALNEARSTTINQLAAGGIFGFFVGVANIVQLSFSGRKWTVSFVNAAVGAMSGMAIAWVLAESNQTMILFLLGGAILGLTARYWIEYVNF